MTTATSFGESRIYHFSVGFHHGCGKYQQAHGKISAGGTLVVCLFYPHPIQHRTHGETQDGPDRSTESPSESSADPFSIFASCPGLCVRIPILFLHYTKKCINKNDHNNDNDN